MRVLLLLLLAAAAYGQAISPMKWSLEAPAKVAPGSTVQLRLKGVIEGAWHLYSPTTPPGPIPTTIKLAESPAIAGMKLYQPPPTRKYDPNFQSDTETYEKEVTFLLLTEIAKTAPAGPLELTAQLRYQMCDDRQCLPPKRVTATTATTVDAAAAVEAVAIPPGYVEAIPGEAAASVSQAPAAAAQQPIGTFLLIAFGAGLAAIFTPCVFPMIPITMSFFLNRENAKRSDSIVQAVVFCLGIVVLFTAMGAVTTAVLGPFGVVQIGSNPWVNGFITVVFVAFALSLLGAFEITLPSGLLTKMNEASGRGGFLGTLLMGLTFALTSFACVGPFVGSLLAASIQGDKLLPLLGMATFSTGLASPFFFLALFPSYLKKLPKSGGWLARVKVVLGFVLLALAIKYASNVDQVLQTGLLTRDRFLAAWVVLFALPGLYLLGLLLLPGVKSGEPLSITRTLFGAAFLIFAVSLLPGMFGGRLGDLEAFIPTPAEGFSGFAGGGGGGQKLTWMKNQYAEALAKAKAENKLVFVNFTGYACTNCHWMKANMFPRPEVQEALSKFVLVELYTDGTDAASEANQELQSKKFSTVAIPYYAILDGDEKVVGTFPGLTRDPQEFLKFLGAGS
ncbi:MAG: cytochrome c biogenesis protein CcdA [Bryobacteraceae bacterium]|nr:cytochrome c biogenesis protein CcdA [Bryobacteraceae bacterium]